MNTAFNWTSSSGTQLSQGIRHPAATEGPGAQVRLPGFPGKQEIFPIALPALTDTGDKATPTLHLPGQQQLPGNEESIQQCFGARAGRGKLLVVKNSHKSSHFLLQNTRGRE